MQPQTPAAPRAARVWQIFLRLAPFLAALPPLAALFLRTPALQAAVYLVFWLYLPGMALAQVLVKAEGRAQKILYAFFLGTAFLFILYYCGALLGSALPVRLVPPLLGAGYLVYCALVRREQTLAQLRSFWQGAVSPLPWLAAAGVWFSFLLTTVAIGGPGEISNPDYLWHMGNVHTLAALPGVEDIRVTGMDFRYHYFSDLIWASGKLAVGLDPYYSILRFSALLAPVPMACSVWLLLRGVLKKPWFAGICAGVALFCAPLYGVYNDFSYQWGSNVNAVGVAVPCGLLLILHMVKGLEAPRVSWRFVLVAFVLACLTTGFKGPFALCAMGAVLGAGLVRLRYKKRPPKRWLFAVLAIVGGFLLVWALLLRTGLNEDYIKSWQPFYSVFTAEVLARPLIALGEGVFARAVLMPLHLVVIFGVFALPFLFAYVRFVARFIGGRGCPDGVLAALAGAVSSLLVFYMLDLTGRSQFYFMYFATPLVAAVAANEVEHFWMPVLVRRKRAVIRIIAAGLSAVMVLFAAAHPMWEPGQPTYSPSEVEAAYWLRDNVATEEKVATNRHHSMYLVSGLAGVRFWLEGDLYARNSGKTVEMLAEQRDLGDDLFRDGVGGKAELARQLEVEWLLQYKSFVADDLHAAPGDGFTLAFAGEDVLIWRLEA